MKRLRLLLLQNQSLLGKLRARAIYCNNAITTVNSDLHKQCGPFAGYWDDWYMKAKEMQEELLESITNTTHFLTELRDFIISLEQKKKLSRNDNSYVLEVTSLTEGIIFEQEELLSSINSRIELHRQLTEKLHLVEAIDSLSDE